ncbi:hypothetical protein HU200_042778 [Digitaria exilis]|uniref:Uncharacterized protein n=1 Tax=Digitaria exilis TaxID=1010633 RepID=A0A835B284_9POAL|nr:hypothetical protein HU200_042778 [Digitaria exilis]
MKQGSVAPSLYFPRGERTRRRASGRRFPETGSRVSERRRRIRESSASAAASPAFRPPLQRTVAAPARRLRPTPRSLLCLLTPIQLPRALLRDLSLRHALSSLLAGDNPIVAKFRKKAFPLFSSLEKLYEGSVATGDLNFTSTENPISAAQRVESTPRRSTSEQSTHETQAAPNAQYNGMAFFGRNPFSSFHDSVEGTEAQSAPLNHNLEDQEGGGGKRRKQSQTAAKLGDYIDFRKSQIQKTVEKLDEKKRHEDEYSVEKCIDIVDGMEDLSDEQKADANELFQTEMNR